MSGRKKSDRVCHDDRTVTSVTQRHFLTNKVRNHVADKYLRDFRIKLTKTHAVQFL